MKITILNNTQPKNSVHLRITPEHINKIQKIAPTSTITQIDQGNEKDHIKRVRLSEIIFSIGSFPAIELLHNSKIQWIHVMSAGVDNVPLRDIPLEVILTNSSGVHPQPIAEHVFAMMLTLARQMHVTIRTQIREGIWRRPDESKITEVHDAIIGVIGYGRIGEEIARLARAFHMRVLAVKRSKTEKDAHVDKLFTMKGLDNVLKECDYAVNCLPKTQETIGLFDLKKFEHMKKDAYFINIGRGVTVVEKDLTTALRTNMLAGAGLDVFEHEPLSEDSPLWNLENVIITPHYAGATPKYMDRVVDIFCDNLHAFLSRKPLPNEVDKTMGY